MCTFKYPHHAVIPCVLCTAEVQNCRSKLLSVLPYLIPIKRIICLIWDFQALQHWAFDCIIFNQIIIFATWLTLIYFLIFLVIRSHARSKKKAIIVCFISSCGFKNSLADRLFIHLAFARLNNSVVDSTCTCAKASQKRLAYHSRPQKQCSFWSVPPGDLVT